MARQRVNLAGAGGATVDTDITSKLAAVTTLITAASTARALIATDRTAHSETNATVTSDVTACQTAITAIQTAVTAMATDVGPAIVIDVDFAVITSMNALNAALAAAAQKFREMGLS